jgi:hypothetical protein
MITQLGHAAGLIDKNTVVVASTRNGGLCGGDLDPRVVAAQAVVDRLRDAPERDNIAIQVAEEKVKMAIELRNITSESKSKGGFEHSIRNADKLNKPYLLLESVSRCEAAKKARPKFVPMCSRIQACFGYVSLPH